VSTVDQNLDSQRLELGNYLKARDWKNVTWYEDFGRTGTNQDREALQTMLKDARSRKLDTILVLKMDRLGRSLKDLVLTLAEFKALGVTFISIRDSLDFSTPQGQLLANLLGSFAEFEAALIRERTKLGINAARARGVKFGRPQKLAPTVVMQLKKNGLTHQEIAVRLGATKGAVSKVLRKSGWKARLKDVS
jgi:DNA invertase Pin-like site-specific DNA recombinase